MNILSSSQLLLKYDRPVPRYTSYPAVPNWQSETPGEEEWIGSINASLRERNELSLYIHLPFCERLCTYCACTKRITKNHALERPYLEAVWQEWQLYLAKFSTPPRIKTLHLGGGTPTFFAPENLEWLLGRILASVPLAKDYEFSFEAHPANTTEEHLRVLRGLGFDRLSIGVQDFDTEILTLINRPQTVEQVTYVTQTARTLGCRSVNFDFVFGLPRQTGNHIQRNMHWVAKLRPDRIAYYSYAHVPWRNPGQRAYDESDLPLGPDKRALYDHGKAALLELGYREVGMDHFALEGDRLLTALDAGALHRNFMGYTDRYTELMIGLGASSISDSWTAFVQNEKKIEVYQDRVGRGRLPLIKGHMLNGEDQLLRRLILRLSCNYYTVLPALVRRLEHWPAMHATLEALEQDGLILYDPYCITVTPTSRPFVRNICQALDTYWHANTDVVERYSRAV